jgi:hypothetical protein
VQPRAGARRRRRAGRRPRVLLQSHLARSGEQEEGILDGDRRGSSLAATPLAPGGGANGLGRRGWGESGAEWKEKVGGDDVEGKEDGDWGGGGGFLGPVGASSYADHSSCAHNGTKDQPTTRLFEWKPRLIAKFRAVVVRIYVLRNCNEISLVV